MLRMDISTLKRSELRSLLQAARARGQDSLADQLEAELSARADERPVVAAEPRSWAAAPDEVLPIELPEPDLRFDAPPAERPAKARWPLGLAAAVVIAAGGALAWNLRPAEPTPPPKASQAAPPTPSKPPPPAREGAVATATRPEPEPDPEPEPAPVVAKAEPVRERPTRLDPCATPPSPAERLLCGDLALNLLDHELRDAYGRALEAGADPIALRDGQAAWRRTRDPIRDPRALADAYDRRIRELKALAEAN